MIKHPFEEFVQHGTPSPEQLSRIAEYHFIPINQIAETVDLSIGSCFRSKGHETVKGRSPREGRKYWGAHTFEVNDRDPEGRGAGDLSSPFLKDLVALVENHMIVSRIALYPWGIHYDYCYRGRGLRYFDSDWNELERDEFYSRL